MSFDNVFSKCRSYLRKCRKYLLIVETANVTRCRNILGTDWPKLLGIPDTHGPLETNPCGQILLKSEMSVTTEQTIIVRNIYINKIMYFYLIYSQYTDCVRLSLKCRIGKFFSFCVQNNVTNMFGTQGLFCLIV